MNEAEFRELIELQREEAGVEFKGPASRTDKAHFEKVVRAVLAMANRRDGGYVIVGVDDDNGRAVLTGLTPEQVATWTNSDHVRDALTVYAEPSVDVDVEVVQYENKAFVVLTVKEFVDVPVLCRRDGGSLQEGAIYVRSRRKPESVPVPRQAEMRDLLDLAAEKRLRSYLAMTTRAGAALMPYEAISKAPAQEATSEDHYRSERESLQSAAAGKARSRGFWEFGIAPVQYERERIAKVTDLFDIVEAARVQLRGWPYPAVLPQHPTIIGQKEAGQDVDSRMHIESWRLFQSGQFTHVLGLWEDWQSEGDWRNEGRQMPKVGDELWIDATIWTLTEFFEFASRLTLSHAGAPQVRLCVAIHGIQGRKLVTGRDRAPFIVPPHASIEAFVFDDLIMTPQELAAGAATKAAEYAQALFQRFGWDAGIEMMRDAQLRLRRGR
ncbi:ATP-binding protein [Gemmatimonas sp.]|uniref:AlbA family DNA-binding domain-containing protein n=1 Tax=Gemmatimonas sp. TaxID=1962908 RepID=UPI0025BA6233|nr:ATP-binding protein [Gemmatimonas sp.]MCA2991620.1 ATP-binding protein [Gemmatimonas sp.]